MIEAILEQFEDVNTVYAVVKCEQVYMKGCKLIDLDY